MSSRLKRKLGDIGVDPSSQKANESFCQIGTPLPPLEKSKDNGEFVPLWKQDVRDEQGRRRLHGAFTGGFSAGYFNTVGSKEGWTPQTFISSRSARAKPAQKSARPEDFMDEEDLAEIRDAQTMVDVNDEMDLLGTTTTKPDIENENENDPLTSTLQKSLFLPPPKDSIGALILKKMGWRIGQGIGPRLTHKQKKTQDARLFSSSSSLPEGEEDEGEGADEADKHTYAPRDTPILLVDRKDNVHGLGYTPGMRLNDSLGPGRGGNQKSKEGEGGKGPNLAAGFGLGALNDADEDDLDVYDNTRGGGGGRRHQAYDINEREDEDDDRIVIGQSRERGRTHPEQKKVPGQTQTFNDGRVVLDGFILSDKPVAEDRWFPLPDIPKGWKPNPKRVWERSKNKENENENVASVQGAVPHRQWKTGISADERGSMLGETPLPSAPRSVFEYISQKDRERIQNAAAPSGSSQSQQTLLTPERPRGPSTITVPRTERQVATAALRGFQPFTADPVKQARYTAYLTSMANPPPEDFPGSGCVPISMMPGQSVDEFNKELDDYKKAAVIFKPISSAMANRFTSAKFVGGVGDPQAQVVQGLTVPSVESENAKRIEEAQRKERDGVAEIEDESPKAHAARMGMYGQMTREVKVWMPAKLLCKRFGVKDPNPEPVVAAEPSAAPEPAPTPGDTSMMDPTAALVAGTESFFAPAKPGGGGGGRKDPSNIGLGEDDSQGRDTLTYQRPAKDIFKAIFASDDEDSDGEDEDKMEVDEPAKPVVEPVASAREAQTAAVPSTYQPGTDAVSNAPEKVDITSFKPTFIPRDGTKSKDKDKSRGKKDKKKKGSERTIVSFDVDEDGGESLSLSIPKDKDKDRPKKKKKRKDKEKEKDKALVEEEDDWVEKPPPEAVKTPSLPVPPDAMQVDEVPDRGRKKAIDFW